MSLAFFLTLVGKQFYRVTLRKLSGVTHDVSVYSSNAHIPSASSFYSLYGILYGIQSGILSLTFDLTFHLTFSLASFLWHPDLTFLSDILLCVFSRRKKSCEANNDFQAVKVRRSPQKPSHCKSLARPTTIRNWQVQSQAGKCCPARRRKKEGRRTS